MLCSSANLVQARGLLDKQPFDAAHHLLAAGSSEPAMPAPAFEPQRNEPARKSVGRAFLLSMMVPGLGEWYAGGNMMAPYFVGLEAGLWLGFSTFRMYSGWLSDDYKTFAKQHAGTLIDGQQKQYFVDIGNFDSIWEFNEFQGVQRDFDSQYPETEQYIWQWDSEENRTKFKSDRVESDRAFNRSTTVLTVIFINHICSAINAAITARQWNHTLPANAELRLKTLPPVPGGAIGGALVLSVPVR